MAKSKVVLDYKLEHTNKELDGRLTSLLLLARFFSSVRNQVEKYLGPCVMSD
jgi:hypothetical protein